jgi:hypothetical protein
MRVPSTPPPEDHKKEIAESGCSVFLTNGKNLMIAAGLKTNAARPAAAERGSSLEKIDQHQAAVAKGKEFVGCIKDDNFTFADLGQDSSRFKLSQQQLNPACSFI